MKLKKHISYKSDKQIWRLLINEKDDLLIETRDTSTKEVSYFILNIPTKQVIRKNLLLPDNIWLGVESFFGDYIYFHKFIKPDLPMHLGIFAYNLTSDKIEWETLDYTFLLVNDDVVVAQKQGFEETSLFYLNGTNGNLISSASLTVEEIEEMHNKFIDSFNFELYGYPENYDLNDDNVINSVIEKYTKSFPLKYNPQFMLYEELFLCNFHLLTNNGISNYFVAGDYSTGKIKEEIVLNKSVNAFVPESFFTYKNYLILLKEKSEVLIFNME
jgi:hypothetical protein